MWGEGGRGVEAEGAAAAARSGGLGPERGGRCTRRCARTFSGPSPPAALSRPRRLAQEGAWGVRAGAEAGGGQGAHSAARAAEDGPHCTQPLGRGEGGCAGPGGQANSGRVWRRAGGQGTAGRAAGRLLHCMELSLCGMCGLRGALPLLSVEMVDAGACGEGTLQGPAGDSGCHAQVLSNCQPAGANPCPPACARAAPCCAARRWVLRLRRNSWVWRAGWSTYPRCRPATCRWVGGRAGGWRGGTRLAERQGRGRELGRLGLDARPGGGLPCWRSSPGGPMRA